jgi:acetate kinase
MKILVLNSGSSSLKFILFEMNDESVLISGMVDRIGISGSILSFQEQGGRSEEISVNIPDFGAALDTLFRLLAAESISALSEIPAIAHRVAHGGKFLETVIITPEVLDQVRSMNRFFPLHHPAMILEIEECMRRMPHSLHVAVFDNSFHRNIPDEAAIYGLPYRYFSEKGYKRTGYHGNSHAFSAHEAAKFLNVPLKKLRIITCHLGNGCSLCAVKHGMSIDTSLGISAIEGLIMGTRCGDVDPGLLPIIMEEENLSPSDLTNMLSKQSGLLGISGLSRDMREIETATGNGNEQASLALKAFCYKVKRSMGSMLMALGGCDVLVFTGGIGENSPIVRAQSIEGSQDLGFIIEPTKNSGVNHLTIENPIQEISSGSSTVKILVVRANEELMMARECLQIARKALQI